MRGSFAAKLPGEGLDSKTAFERNMLPGFAEWALEQIERWEPDYLVPAETKGARVLDAVLSYGRNELGARVPIPVVYGSALSYLPPQELRTARMMIVEDGVRTGSNLGRHRDLIAGHEVEEIEAIACIGCGADPERRTEVACFLHADPELYQRYVWQLTELVVARGLPPEVDHFLFELQLPGRLAVSYPQLASELSHYGMLTIDGPAWRADEIQSMTLHFPRLPGAEALPPESGDGAFKVRFFPDPANERVFVVPISLPTLTMPGAKPGVPAARGYATEAITRELGHVPPISELLVERAFTLDPRTLFRAVSAGREVELMRGLADVLRDRLPGSSLRAQGEVFERLFGAAVGSDVAVLVAEKVSEVLGGLAQAPEALPEAESEPPLFLDSDVETATEGIARELKSLYDVASEDPEHDPATRVGLAMSELAALLPGKDPLLASRCVDFGLALTTLVPYIDELPDADGVLRIQRCYRVSENNRGKDRSYLSLDSIRRKKSEEAVALICMRLQQTLPGYENQPIPTSLLSPIVSIMQTLVLAAKSISLKALPTPADGLDLILLDTVDPVRIGAEVSGDFVIDDGGSVAPTEGFEERYRRRLLRLDLDDCTEAIEENLDKIVSLLSGLEQTEQGALLAGWAMATDRRLGLSHVRSSIQSALDSLRRPLNLIRTSEPHARSEGTAERTALALESARRKLEVLKSNWSEPAERDAPKAGGRSRDRVLGSLGAAHKSPEIFEFAEAVCDMIGALGDVVERLDVVSAEEWPQDRERQGKEVASQLRAGRVKAEHALCGLASQKTHVPGGKPQSEAEVEAVAEELLDLVEHLKAFAAAIAGVYCGPNTRIAPPNAGAARHAAILSLDLADSTARAEAVEPDRNKRWVNEGLNLAAQWTRVFGGYEFSDRKGDELIAEFESGDRAALTGAVVLAHAAALRSTGLPTLSWSFHAGVDYGEIDDADGGNIIGSCVNRAAKLAKAAPGGQSTVTVGEEGLRFCSPVLRSEPLSLPGEEVSIGERQMHPRHLDSTATITELSARIREAAAAISQELPPMAELVPPLEGSQGEIGADAAQAAG